MQAPRLIALYSAVMRSGKSEAASVLQSERGFRLVKFAQPAKDIVKSLLMQGGATEAVADRMIEGDLKERIIPTLGVSTRRLLQTLGTDWGRNQVNPDIWVRLATLRIEEALKAGFNVVVDDMRFPNEYEAIIQLGGHPVKVIRTGTQPYSGHASEGLLEGYPMSTLENNSTLGEFRACVARLPELLSR